MYHMLRLFQTGTDAGTPTIVKNKPLISESYDEIVFQEPTVLMKALLDSVTPMTAGVWKHEVDCKWELVYTV